MATETTTLNIKGMMCQGCVAGVEAALSQLDGVEDAAVSLDSNSAEVRYDSAKVDTGDLSETVAKAGYEVVN